MAKKKIRVTIRTLEESFKEDMKFASEVDKGIFKKHIPELSFTNFKMYKKMLTQKRLELLSIIKIKKPKSIKELSVISNRDFKNIYDDIKILKTLGFVKLKKSSNGLTPIVLYDEIDIAIKIPIEAISA